MATDASLRGLFGPALDAVAEQARPGEITVGWLDAERSDFVRFNRGRVGQCGTVERARLELRLIANDAQARRTLTLSGSPDEDRARIGEGFDVLRAALADVEPDPHLSFCERPTRSLVLGVDERTPPREIADAVSDAAGGADLVGFYAGGPLACALASSVGHEHWHESPGWCFDWSIFVGDTGGDKALKSTVSGREWSARSLRASVAESVARARVLARPALRIAPGRQRCWLAPPAVAELIELFGWGGFSARAHRSGHSPLSRLRAGTAGFDARVAFAEDLAGLGVPRFQSDGFVRPARVELVRDGRFADWLASPRSAREFGIDGNGSAAAESPEALSMAPGDLDENDALRALGNGIAVSNLWYLNFSDREACRVTGMTRFATVWVEDGEPVAPVEVMRFDDSAYRLLGEALEAIGARAHRIARTETYERRQFGVTAAPGLLLRGMDFTL